MFSNSWVNCFTSSGGSQDALLPLIGSGPDAAEAATAGHDVIASPFSHLYFDLGDPRNTELVYKYEPMPEGLSDEQARHILGPSAPAWNQPQERADEMIFPRLLALSEVGWTSRDNRDWEDFVARSKAHYRRLALLGVKFPRDWALGGPGTRIGDWKPADLTADRVALGRAYLAAGETAAAEAEYQAAAEYARMSGSSDARSSAKAGLGGRIETRACSTNSLKIDDLVGKVDFVLAFAVVHEIPDRPRLFRELAAALAPEGRILLSEPSGHVSADDFAKTLADAASAGLKVV